jgi:hypothetical protein
VCIERIRLAFGFQVRCIVVKVYLMISEPAASE